MVPMLQTKKQKKLKWGSGNPMNMPLLFCMLWFRLQTSLPNSVSSAGECSAGECSLDSESVLLWFACSYVLGNSETDMSYLSSVTN